MSDTKHPTLSFSGASDPTFTAIANNRRVVGTYYDAKGDTWSFQKAGKDERRLYISRERPTAEGINDRGEIVGHVVDYPWPMSPRETCNHAGFLYAGDIPDDYYCYGSVTTPMDINNRGVEVGNYLPDGHDGLWCYIRDGDRFHPFRVVETHPCTAHDVDETGTVVAGSHTLFDGRDQGWVYRNGSFQIIEIPGAYSTWVEHIGADGSIHGSYMQADEWSFRGFSLWPNGEMTVVHVPGAVSTCVKGGNSRGDLVGRYVVQDSPGNSHAGGFIANPAKR
jgi:hypothetical protein